MNVLAFFAHPDDETMMAGGALMMLARQGLQVHYYSATRGEGGEVGEPPLCTFEELGTVREVAVRGGQYEIQILSTGEMVMVDMPGAVLGPSEWGKLVAELKAIQGRLVATGSRG